MRVEVPGQEVSRRTTTRGDRPRFESPLQVGELALDASGVGRQEHGGAVLCPLRGDALAEFRTEALPTDFEMDAGPAELGKADQSGDDAVPACWVQGKFGDLVDQDRA
jgi:hypothetical protein